MQHRRTALAACLLLVIAPTRGLPARSTPLHAGAAVRVTGTAGGLLAAAADGSIAVRVEARPLRIEVRGAGGRSLLRAAFSFGLDRPALRGLLPARAAPTGSTGQVAVHLLRLLGWAALPDGATVLAATDDPLGRRARIAIHLSTAEVARFVARLADDRAVRAAGLAAASGPDEHFFGLGEQFGGVDQRGRQVGVLVQDGMTTLRPNGGYAPAPFFVSTRGYGFYLAGSRPSRFALDAPPDTATWQATAQAASLDCAVLDGPAPAAVIARYADLSGHPPMPAPWTLGVWKTAIGGQARVLAEARRLRQAHIPISVLWSYDAVDEAAKLGWPYPNFARIPPGPYPDLPAFTAALHRQGYQVLGYVAPEFTRSRPGFAYPARHGYFVAGGGGVYLLDLTNPAALAWWQGNERRILTTLGFDGWLLDLGDRLPHDARFADGRGALDLANLYPLLLAQAAEEVAPATKPDALFVMRSGFSGVQRLQRAVWAGDQRANWSPAQGLPAAISAGLSWGISGAPFWGSDIGGYLDGGLPPAQQEELWLRWLEFGALSPIMRDQLGNKGYDAVYLWSNARTQAAFRFYAQFHQSLFPYLYAAARTAHLTGLPIMRHLALAYPRDPLLYGLDDEYLLGPDLLVAPVTRPGPAGRRVYLPAGTWIDYWTGTRLQGGRAVEAAAPLLRIPLFVRGGALLPTLTDPGDTLAPASDPAVHGPGAGLWLHLYGGGAGEQTTLADGTALTSRLDPRGAVLRIDGPERWYRIDLELARTPNSVRRDGRDLPRAAGPNSPGWRYDPRTGTLRIVARLGAGTLSIGGVLR